MYDLLNTIINYPYERNSLKLLESITNCVLDIAEILNTCDVVNNIIPFVLCNYKIT
jgi:hypothetical protein